MAHKRHRDATWDEGHQHAHDRSLSPCATRVRALCAHIPHVPAMISLMVLRHPALAAEGWAAPGLADMLTDTFDGAHKLSNSKITRKEAKRKCARTTPVSLCLHTLIRAHLCLQTISAEP